MVEEEKQAQDIEQEIINYEIDLGAQFRTIDGDPLTQVRTEKVQVESNGEMVIEEKEMPAEPYRVVESLMVVLDNIPADFYSRHEEEVKDLYYNCVSFINTGEGSVITVSETIKRMMPYFGIATRALTTYLSLQLGEQFKEIK